MNQGFVKYLTHSENDLEWGLVCTVAGYSNIIKGEVYPLLDHPLYYMFKWEKGRAILEYQLIYIYRGEGVFESHETGIIQVNQGSVIMLFPGIWHRYRPLVETGWNEQYVGFKGKIVDQWVKKNFFAPTKPIIQIGINHDIESIFEMIFSAVKEEKSGFQQALSGLIMALLTNVSAISKNRNVGSSVIDSMIIKSKSLMLKNLKGDKNITKIANETGVGYSLFRKTFKEYTGISPLQYMLQLRLHEAKKLLSTSNLMIKEIANELGFESPFYFSRIFKQKCGITAEEYRRRSRGNDRSYKE